MSLSHFDPLAFDDDIYVVEVVGLGRGRGVKVVGQYSILQPGDQTVELIKTRILNLLKVMLDNGVAKPNEVFGSLNLKAVSLKEFSRLKDELETLSAELEDSRRRGENWRVEAESLKAEVGKLKQQLREKEAELMSLYEEIDSLTKEVEDALSLTGKWVWSEDEDSMEALKERVRDLIGEYEALAAETEEYE